ncbi:M23 family peptidase [Gramella sp. BOM4]|nr:M23 family peptidase [Christiangramia bathymodioli]
MSDIAVKRLFFILLMVLLASCSQLEKVDQVFSRLSEREKYQKENEISDELFQLWNNRIEVALADSLEIKLPYTENGHFRPRNFAIYSYQTYLLPGEIVEVKTTADSLPTRVFSELYRKIEGSGKFEKIASGKTKTASLNFEIEEPGLYKFVIQPEIEANSPFRMQILKSPSYKFPVLNAKNNDIGSYWGDMRDGGKRNHEGIDIFAKRGTPVLAATDGRIRFTGEKGLGGKQVWLRDPERDQSLYYSHLDSIVPGLTGVKAGDTLGFVGNTGNARTTPPHLHFGIYQSGHGAIDPLGFVYQTELAKPDIEPSEARIASKLKITSRIANLRNSPSTSNSQVLSTAKSGTSLSVQGKTEDWFHVRDSLDRSMYVHESLVSPAL